MNIAIEPVVAELASLIHRGLLGRDNVNLCDDLRGVLARNEQPNTDTELLTALDAIPYGIEIKGYPSVTKDLGVPSFREQLAMFIGGKSCAHTCIANGTCQDCGESFKQDLK